MLQPGLHQRAQGTNWLTRRGTKSEFTLAMTPPRADLLRSSLDQSGSEISQDYYPFAIFSSRSP